MFAGFPHSSNSVTVRTSGRPAKLASCRARSISSDPTLKGAPTGWRLPVREVRASVGAGFVYPICGDMRTMPGLPMHPAVHRIDIDDHGEVVGLA